MNDDETKCLGKSKGRVYEAMDSQSDNFLRNYYRKPNIALSKLLGKLAQPIPEWLEEELGDLRWRLAGDTPPTTSFLIQI